MMVMRFFSSVVSEVAYYITPRVSPLYLGLILDGSGILH